MKKIKKLEFIKKNEEVDFIASLLISMCKTNNISYILLSGEIGSGKTTLVKEIAKQLGDTSEVVSPTFNKMLIYNKIVHIDAYNIKNKSLDEYQDFFDDKIIIIEWYKNIKQEFEQAFIVDIIFIDNKTRKYIIEWKE